VVDTRVDAPASTMIEDLEGGRIDVAILWGPIAGYLAKNAKTPLKVTPLVKETSGQRLIYRIGMGVRHSDQEWKRLLNKLIAENQAEITHILTRYGVPLLDENNGRLTE
jgi:ABC-type amino acid transport substrate-binding protein